MTPEQHTEAALAIALERVPMWVDRIWTLAAAARDAAPEGEANAWIDAICEASIKDYAELCSRIVSTAGANTDQAQRFAHQVADAMRARFAELTAGGATQGGRA